jgi:hypothetical protein
MTSPSSSATRPRAVSAAFWLLLAAGTALVAAGTLVAIATSGVPGFYRAAGALFGVAGAALGYLVGRARHGDARFRNATVGLALALAVLLVPYSLSSRGMVWLLIVVAVLVGATLLTRPGAQGWFDPGGRR